MGKVAALEGVEVEDIGEEGYKRLGGFELNGREVGYSLLNLPLFPPYDCPNDVLGG